MRVFLITSSASNMFFDRNYLEGIEGMSFTDYDAMCSFFEKERKRLNTDENVEIADFSEIMDALNDSDDQVDDVADFVPPIKENFFTYVGVLKNIRLSDIKKHK